MLTWSPLQAAAAAGAARGGRAGGLLPRCRPAHASTPSAKVAQHSRIGTGACTAYWAMLLSLFEHLGGVLVRPAKAQGDLLSGAWVMDWHANTLWCLPAPLLIEFVE